MNNKLSGFLRPNQQSAAAIVPDGNLDYAILALGYLILVGWYPSDASPKTVWIGIADHPPKALHAAMARYVREDVTKQLANAKRQAPYKAGYVCAIRLSAAMEEAIHQCMTTGARLDIGFELGAGAGPDHRYATAVLTAADALKSKILTGSLLQLAIESLSEEPAARTGVGFRLLASLDVQSRVSAHIDLAMTNPQAMATLRSFRPISRLPRVCCNGRSRRARMCQRTCARLDAAQRRTCTVSRPSHVWGNRNPIACVA
jgi:hypothetical protein